MTPFVVGLELATRSTREEMQPPASGHFITLDFIWEELHEAFKINYAGVAGLQPDV